MNGVLNWVNQNFDVTEIDSITHVYSGIGPPSWQQPQTELTRELDPCRPGDWWRMVCLMDLCGSIKPDMRILDIGCGTGWPSIHLARFVKEIIAVDGSELAISLIKRNLRESGIMNVIAKRADSNGLPFGDMSFDAVIMSDLIDVVPDPVRVASEAFRVLKHGGIFVSWVQNFRFILGDRDGIWIHSVNIDGDLPLYKCHFATLYPPCSIQLQFHIKQNDGIMTDMGLPTKPESTTTDQILIKLDKFRSILEDHVEIYQTVEFTPENADEPFRKAGFTDIKVHPINMDMCTEFAFELINNNMLPKSKEEFQTLASALLKAMLYVDFSKSPEISVEGRRP